MSASRKDPPPPATAAPAGLRASAPAGAPAAAPAGAIAAQPLWARVRTPLLILAGNRFALFLLCFLGLALVPTVTHPWRAFPRDLFLDGWFRWDAGWYLRVATQGYDPIPGDQQPTNFFPLYPLLIRLFAPLFGSPYIAGFVISNASLALAVVWLHRFVAREHGRDIADRTLLLLLCNPFAYAYSAMYTESLFLLGIAGAFVFATEERWLFASLCAAAAGATRLVGILAMMPVGLYYLRSRGWRWNQRGRLDPQALFLPLGAAGLVAHMIFLGAKFGRPLAFLDAQWVGGGWGNDMTWSSLMTLLSAITSWSTLAAGKFEVNELSNLTVALLALLVLSLTARRIGWIPALWAFATLAISLRIWKGAGRYSAVIFPVSIGGAILTENRPLLFQSWLTASTLLLALLLYAFSHGQWIC